MDGEGSVRSALPEDLWAPAPPEGLYVHVPFCVSICPYCDFVVYGGAAARGPRTLVGELVDALHAELALRTGTDGAGAPLKSVYIGGGTPSLLAAAAVAGLLEDIDRRLGIAMDAEVTLEVNPGPDERGDLAGFRFAGVTRLSIGAQSLDPLLLRRLGRRHAAADVTDTVAASRAAGIRSIGLDLLTDIPGQSVDDWRSTLRAALRLEPDHLSVYSLALDDPDAEGLTGATGDHLPLRAGARRWREKARREQSEERAAEMEAITDELAAAAGLCRYEIANLARPGHESRHNRLYWERRPYLAIGPGAHASDGGLVRTWNAASLRGYLDALHPTEGRQRRLPPGDHERVSPATAAAERAILGLRLTRGIGADVASGDPAIERGLAWAAARDLVARVGDRVRLTARGRLLSNEVFARLLPDPEHLVPPTAPAEAVLAIPT